MPDRRTRPDAKNSRPVNNSQITEQTAMHNTHNAAWQHNRWAIWYDWQHFVPWRSARQQSCTVHEMRTSSPAATAMKWELSGHKTTFMLRYFALTMERLDLWLCSRTMSTVRPCSLNQVDRFQRSVESPSTDLDMLLLHHSLRHQWSITFNCHTLNYSTWLTDYMHST